MDQAELAAVFARLSGPTAKGRAAALSVGRDAHQAAGRVFGLVSPSSRRDPRPRCRTAPWAVGRADALERWPERSGVEAELRFNRQARITVLRELRSRVDVLEGRLLFQAARPGSEV